MTAIGAAGTPEDGRRRVRPEAGESEREDKRRRHAASACRACRERDAGAEEGPRSGPHRAPHKRGGGFKRSRGTRRARLKRQTDAPHVRRTLRDNRTQAGRRSPSESPSRRPAPQDPLSAPKGQEPDCSSQQPRLTAQRAERDTVTLPHRGRGCFNVIPPQSGEGVTGLLLSSI